MKLGVRSGWGLVVAATLFAAPVMGQEDSEEEADSNLQDAADVAQTAAEQALDRAMSQGDDALHAIPVTATSHGDDVARGAGAAVHADDLARGVGLGAVSHADDAARFAGGSLAKIGGVLAALGAILVKLFVGKKDE